MSMVRPPALERAPGQARFPWSHVAGYALSIVLTLAAFWAVLGHALPTKPLLAGILLLAVLQILVQLVFFMHVGQDSKPRYHLWLFSVAMFFFVVFVVSSMWILTFNTPIS
ncbi:cytochrome o ubiquinol oxidase subunit IV [Alicyclobacillus macrosporangiidus]|uniref:Cytochrome o ubiquinol oxidase operon protein cyoD n=1 Tax=Alicyclobacillus macrosporangiidus TaxID=392015 RepID=A0A1I7G8V3_9BACL|nr:cytochrome C oxidase subunit IV family protein [Alicyclobacillus macrosporangiidus]SFU44686.1 cytochrome o ubiquinol oxidase operon protein cyoD [Alicyclobacillus macrosporangiidus]